MSTAPIDAAKRQPTRNFEDATPLLADASLLQARADRDGYLFFKGLIPRELIIELRRQIMNILNNRGYLVADHPIMEGIADVEHIHRILTEDDVNWNGVGVPEDVYREVQKLEAFQALSHEPNVVRMYRMLLGEEPFAHPRNIGRLMLPHKGVQVTPSHQDFLHIQGTEQTWTCWMPVGDAPRTMGSLSILEGSHKAGLLGVTNAPGAGGLETILCNLGYQWAAGDYEAGDLVTFHSLTVHRALPNQTPDRIRLSADLRFQPLSAPIDPSSLMPHGPYEWDDLYAGWTREDLQYYWKRNEFEFTQFDESIRWQKEKIC